MKSNKLCNFDEIRLRVATPCFSLQLHYIFLVILINFPRRKYLHMSRPNNELTTSKFSEFLSFFRKAEKLLARENVERERNAIGFSNMKLHRFWWRPRGVFRCFLIYFRISFSADKNESFFRWKLFVPLLFASFLTDKAPPEILLALHKRDSYEEWKIKTKRQSNSDERQKKFNVISVSCSPLFSSFWQRQNISAFAITCNFMSLLQVVPAFEFFPPYHSL